ncbi:hypothetical protein Spith_1802 [Spirochaeta thermophila DSM 6578]|uniref:Uncharacterized protein n=1 Tax=Winmispira thermophila (strain ATCC 700085 / DSM 6578 / Z-1203) TaxID=869211 RepID=G0GCJ5_WINT7|nr:hypothetical protein [Spirochaeta thermophila]AEJ62061.1 hypothetical protein Spith_1802 [Spirochaeta thermophila DSM 6578]
MTEQEFRKAYEGILEDLERLPDHAPDIIQKTAAHLDMLSFSFTQGKLDLDLVRITKAQLREELERLASLGPEEFEAELNMEKPYSGGDREAWARKAKLQRMRFLLDKYAFVCRLRDNDPETWDAVNELFYDD